MDIIYGILVRLGSILVPLDGQSISMVPNAGSTGDMDLFTSPSLPVAPGSHTQACLDVASSSSIVESLSVSPPNLGRLIGFAPCENGDEVGVGDDRGDAPVSKDSDSMSESYD